VRHSGLQRFQPHFGGRWATLLFVIDFPAKETKMKLDRLVSAAALLLFVSFVAVSQDKTTGAIKGKVRVEKGSPAGVAVILRQGEREVTRTTTNKNGDFVLARVAPGIYGVTLRKPGLSVGSIEPVEVIAGKTRTLGDHLVLSVDEGSIAFIRGSVFTEGGRSVPGVRIELARIVSENSTQKIDYRMTGETGEFVFRLPPEAAKYRLTLKADGIETATKDVEVESAAVYRVAFTAKPIPK
jgi:hypothetical protein